MWRIAKIIIQNGSLVLFVILQSLCLFWIVKFNQNQQKIYLHSYQLMASGIQSKYQYLISYFSLRERYDSIAVENAKLRSNQINTFSNSQKKVDSLINHKSEDQLYQLIPARVINNALDKRNNMITLDKGGKHNIAPGMGVITNKGIVGIVTDTSSNYSLVMSVLHSNTNISARLKRCGFFGSLIWNGKDPSIMNLQAIQKYADVRLGDTIVTSGYSIAFPKNLLIGTVDMYKVEEGSFTFKINVALSQSMTNIDQVYVILSHDKGEKENLEKKSVRYE
ncbi:MAG: rod shape-determining protein MreC [Saprospiraceae bacterium]|nr:rod shape-determining protein MreC [Saprospiraceae bacterium]